MYLIKHLLLVCLLAIKNGDAYLKNRPSFLGTCSIDDANFNRCYAANLKSILSATNGMLDPLHINKVSLPNAKSANYDVSILWTNVFVDGLKNAIFTDARLLTQTSCSTKINILLPKTTFFADYSMNGTAYSFPLNSDGKSFLKMDNISVLISMQCKKLGDIDDCTFADIEAVKVNITKIEGLRIHWDILSGGDEDLEAQARVVINENWPEAWEILRPVLQSSMEPILLDRYKKFAESVPFSCRAADKPN